MKYYICEARIKAIYRKVKEADFGLIDAFYSFQFAKLKMFGIKDWAVKRSKRGNNRGLGCK